MGLVPSNLRFSILVALWLPLSLFPVASDAHPCAAGNAVSGSLETTLDANGFMIAGDRRTYVLAGIHAVSAAALRRYKGTPLKLWLGEGRTDRFGRNPVQAFGSENEAWIQGELLKEGWTVAYGIGLPSDCMAALKQMEKQARARSAGVWAEGNLLFQARDVEELARRQGTFAIVEGTVETVGNRRNRLYLNFGPNWSEDFTATIIKKGRNAFSGDLQALAHLGGRRVHIRGMIENAGGPLIRVFDGSQIDILGDE